MCTLGPLTWQNEHHDDCQQTLMSALITWTRGHQSVTEGGGAPLLPRLLQQLHAGLGGKLTARALTPAEVLSCDGKYEHWDKMRSD